MQNLIKTEIEIQTMREGGRLIAQMVQELGEMIRPGLDTWDLEVKFIEMCAQNKVRPACKGYSPYSYPPFPTGLCVSINQEVVHGIPKKGIKLKNGDIVTLDTVIEHKGYYVDHAITFPVGEIGVERRKLLKTAKEGLDKAIELVKDGTKVGAISSSMQKTAEDNGYSVSRDYVGHGIGEEMHEDPQIACFGNPKDGPILKAGMTICIETLYAQGTHRIKHKGYWISETLDGKDFAQFEHTVLVKDGGFEILTLPN